MYKCMNNVWILTPTSRGDNFLQPAAAYGLHINHFILKSTLKVMCADECDQVWKFGY